MKIPGQDAVKIDFAIVRGGVCYDRAAVSGVRNRWRGEVHGVVMVIVAIVTTRLLFVIIVTCVALTREVKPTRGRSLWTLRQGQRPSLR